ncbi:type IV conjugative transfer system lipoprotein TraV [Eoetvoesiella caeni]
MKAQNNASINGRFVPNSGTPRTVRLLRVAAVTLTAALAGCSAMNIGSTDYGCQGMPEGVQCMSTRDVYTATNDGNVLRPMTAEEAKDGKMPAVKLPEGQTLSQSPTGGAEEDFVNTYVAPQLPDKPVPIRTPAQVMRIWVAPWEDKNGDLNATGYVYTEIEPRRWVIGESAPADQPILRPLQVSHSDVKNVKSTKPAVKPSTNIVKTSTENAK